MAVQSVGVLNRGAQRSLECKYQPKCGLHTWKDDTEFAFFVARMRFFDRLCT